MKVDEVFDLFKENNIDVIGLNSLCYYGFGYFYKDGKLEVLTNLDVDYRPWSHKFFEGTEDEFVKEWCNKVYNILIMYDLYDKKSKTYKAYMELKEKLK